MTATGERRAGDGDPAPGLSALYAALAHTVERHGVDAFAFAVDDPDLGRQAFAAGAAAGIALEALVDDAGRAWWAAPPLVDPPAELDALRSLALTALRLGRVDPGADPDSALECVVRALPDVVTVRRTGSVVEVTVTAERRDEVVAALAAAPHGGTAAVVIHDLGGAAPAAPEPATGGRAELVAVRSLPETGEVEVHLRAGERRTVGRGPLVRAGAAAAEATLDALAALEPDEPGVRPSWHVAWVRTIDTTPDREFLVAVSIRRDQSTTLYGLASGPSPIEAAARATLHASNRVASGSPTERPD